jgi:hypothetical protein
MDVAVPIAAFRDFAPAIAGLLGVLLGGLITLRIEEKRREHDAQQEKSADAKRLRAVARVWQDEFARALTALAMAKKGGYVWIAPPGGVYFAEMGREERLLLAGALDDDDWLAVVLGHANLTLVVGGIQNHAGETIDPAQFDFEAASRLLTSAHEALSHITGSESHSRLGHPHTPTP